MAVAKQTAELLSSRQQVIEAIRAVGNVLNVIEEHYCKSAPIAYSYVDAEAATMLSVLKAGVEARNARFKHRGLSR